VRQSGCRFRALDVLVQGFTLGPDHRHRQVGAAWAAWRGTKSVIQVSWPRMVFMRREDERMFGFEVGRRQWIGLHVDGPAVVVSWA